MYGECLVLGTESHLQLKCIWQALGFVFKTKGWEEKIWNKGAGTLKLNYGMMFLEENIRNDKSNQ